MSVTHRYDDWIAGYHGRRLTSVVLVGAELMTQEELLRAVLRGACTAATEEMVKAFPELRRVRGHYGNSSHWWCEDADGNVYDPSVAQFYRPSTYTEYSGPEPVGKCMECGELVWSMEYGSYACSKECAYSLNAYYSALVQR